MIRHLTFEIVLQNRQNKLIPSLMEQRQRERNNSHHALVT